MNAIQIPAAGSPITVHDVIEIESTIARQVATVTDLSALEDMRAKADALARYLAGKELHGPMLGAQRRIEARIGQLLGEPSRAPGSLPREGNSISGTDRQRFRLLARGFEVLTDEEWRQSRRAVLALLQARFPTPRSDGVPSRQRHGDVTPSNTAHVSDQSGAGTVLAAASEPQASASAEELIDKFRQQSVPLTDAQMEQLLEAHLVDCEIAQTVERARGRRTPGDTAIDLAWEVTRMLGKRVVELEVEADQFRGTIERLETEKADLQRDLRRAKDEIENLTEKLNERVAIQEESCE